MSIEKLAALCALLLTGCAATPKGDDSKSSQLASAQGQESGKSEKVCTREKPLGSNLPRVVCYTRGQANSLTSGLRRDQTRSPLRGPRSDLEGPKPNG